jgi:hypothetical protein
MPPALSLNYWKVNCPRGYVHKGLEKALKDAESAWAKLDEFRESIELKLKALSLRAIDQFVAELKAAIQTMEKSKGLINAAITATKAVADAARKAMAELTKLWKEEKTDKKKASAYQDGAVLCETIAGMADSTVKGLAE